jgi:tyrosyl-tRNA synthetase
LPSYLSVKSRLESTSGLSFTEFSYQLLQAFDFLTLHQRYGCTIQLGGSDQLGNIMSGIEMIRKSKESVVTVSQDVELGLGGDQVDPAYGLTMPLLTTASGEKFGKSAGNAIWLDSNMTSPFDFYQVSLFCVGLTFRRADPTSLESQFFLRTTDEEVHKYLKIFSFIRVIEIEGIMADHKVSCSPFSPFDAIN